MKRRELIAVLGGLWCASLARFPDRSEPNHRACERNQRVPTIGLLS
jgi:hypothetical protein